MEQLTEKIEAQQPILSLSLTDEELIDFINKKKQDTDELYESKIMTKGKDGLNYYLGNHPVKYGKDGKSKLVENVIFRNVESIVPVLTSNTPEPRIFHPNKMFTEKLRKVFVQRWEVLDKMLEKSRKVIRHNFCYFLGSMKVRYDNELDDIVWDVVHPSKIRVPKQATSYQDCEFIIQHIDDQTVEDVIKKYKYGKKKLLQTLGIRGEDKKALGTKISFIEFSTPKFTVWKYQNIILDKQKNQNWDWGETPTFDEMGQETKTAYNVLRQPTIPYIFFIVFAGVKEDEGMYGNTSLIEQAAPLQDLVNKRKRQIDENADEANGTLTGSGDFISKAQFSTIKGEAKERIWFEKGDARAGVARLPGNPLQGYVFDDYMQSKSEIDNLMGAHSTMRGEGRQGQSTATERVMEKQSDFGRIDDIVKSFEDFCEDYYNMSLQMMLTHYETPHLYPLESEDDITIDRETLIKEFSKVYKYKQTELRGGKYEEEYQYVKPIVMVKRGSTLPTDELSKQQNAMDLAKGGLIDPISLFEDMNDPNPEMRARRLFIYQTNPQMLFPELAQMGQGQQAGGQGQYTEGMIQDTEALQQGQTPDINPEVQNPETAAAHIQGHSDYIDSDEFKKANDEFKQRYIQHTKAEVEAAKGIAEQGPGEQPAQTAQTQPEQPLSITQ